MKEQECSFRDKRVFQYSSAKRYIKFFVPEGRRFDLIMGVLQFY